MYMIPNHAYKFEKDCKFENEINKKLPGIIPQDNETRLQCKIQTKCCENRQRDGCQGCACILYPTWLL